MHFEMLCWVSLQISAIPKAVILIMLKITPLQCFLTPSAAPLGWAVPWAQCFCLSFVQKLFYPIRTRWIPPYTTHGKAQCAHQQWGNTGKAQSCRLPPPPHLHTWALAWPAPRAGCHSGHRRWGSCSCRLGSGAACRCWSAPSGTEHSHNHVTSALLPPQQGHGSAHTQHPPSQSFLMLFLLGSFARCLLQNFAQL